MRDIAQITATQDELFRKLGENIKSTTRCAEPGIIQSFDPVEQTVTVQLALREEITNEDGTKQWVNLPLLLDVPIVMPRAGGYMLTMPIAKDDECLVIFGDMCIDAWWSLGGIQNQIEKRRHDLSDGFAMLGVWSQPNVIPNYKNDSMNLINIKTGTGFSIDSNNINATAEKFLLNGLPIQGTQGTQGIPGIQGKDGIQGATGATGAQGEDAKTFTFGQASAQSIWSITHNLNKIPSIIIVDSADSTVIGDINYISLNEVQISFSSAFAGTAYLT